jgi:hypothetical protein
MPMFTLFIMVVIVMVVVAMLVIVFVVKMVVVMFVRVSVIVMLMVGQVFAHFEPPFLTVRLAKRIYLIVA